MNAIIVEIRAAEGRMKVTTKITVTLSDGAEVILMRDRNYENSSLTDVHAMIADEKTIQEMNPVKVTYECVAIEDIPCSEISAYARKKYGTHEDR